MQGTDHLDVRPRPALQIPVFRPARNNPVVHKRVARRDVEGLLPYDVWDIPNVKGNHVEKTKHPCQYPIVLPKRLIHALTAEGDLVVDPFLGAGTTGAAAVLEGRRFAGAEMREDYIKTAEERIRKAAAGTLRYREDVPVKEPELLSSAHTAPSVPNKKEKK